MHHFVEPWSDSFQEIAEFLTGHQADVDDDRVLATVLFTDIVDSTRRASEMGDRNWRAVLDAHDAVVRSQLARFRGREVNTSGDGFLARANEVLVSGTLRDLVIGSGLEFEERAVPMSSRACPETGRSSRSCPLSVLLRRVGRCRG